VNRSWLIWTLVAFATVAGLVAGLRWATRDRPAADPDAVQIKIYVEGALDRALLVQKPDGSYSYVLRGYDRSTETLSPEQLASRLHSQERSRPRNWLAFIFNISSPIGIIWVSLGLLGQLLFTGRMLVQWLASEKSRRSIVPAAFWWMSLGGALMLLAYFLWRRDIVGVLGQSFGLIVYIRNLHLIYRAKLLVPATVDPAPEPELPKSSETNDQA
jgi:lipid-A-disaccharide synthase-like uncharacterized protein